MDTPEATLLRTIVTAIVDRPEAVEIDQSIDGMGVLLQLKVHLSDMGRVIGREGKTAEAIRLIVRVAGMRNNNRVSITIPEPEGSTHIHREARIAP